jgi:hypothetical protein
MAWHGMATPFASNSNAVVAFGLDASLPAEKKTFSTGCYHSALSFRLSMKMKKDDLFCDMKDNSSLAY